MQWLLHFEVFSYIFLIFFHTLSYMLQSAFLTNGLFSFSWMKVCLVARFFFTQKTDRKNLLLIFSAEKYFFCRIFPDMWKSNFSDSMTSYLKLYFYEEELYIQNCLNSFKEISIIREGNLIEKKDFPIFQTPSYKNVIP